MNFSVFSKFLRFRVRKTKKKEQHVWCIIGWNDFPSVYLLPHPNVIIIWETWLMEWCVLLTELYSIINILPVKNKDANQLMVKHGGPPLLPPYLPPLWPNMAPQHFAFIVRLCLFGWSKKVSPYLSHILYSQVWFYEWVVHLPISTFFCPTSSQVRFFQLEVSLDQNSIDNAYGGCCCMHTSGQSGYFANKIFICFTTVNRRVQSHALAVSKVEMEMQETM